MSPYFEGFLSAVESVKGYLSNSSYTEHKELLRSGIFHRLLCHDLGAGTVRSQALGDVTILLFLEASKLSYEMTMPFLSSLAVNKLCKRFTLFLK